MMAIAPHSPRVRLWSIHPRFLDAKGLVACWREALLAQAVLLGRTRGYRNHPQLDRFRRARDPVAAVGAFLAGVAAEARRRGYRFDAGKIERPRSRARLRVTRGQIEHEWLHLKRKLRQRDPAWLKTLPATAAAHPLFRVIVGPVESWERP